MKISNKDFKQCKQCVMDSTDINLVLDSNGVCNHCHNYFEGIQVSNFERKQFNKHLRDIKQVGGKYNCLVGVSGGLDSTYLLIHIVKDLGLNPLAVHVDNGWNTGLASRNMSNMLKILGVDLHTEVLDWDEFRLMQIAVLKSGTPDLEAPTDLFINYTMRSLAKKFGIRHIVTGTNPQTEGVMGSTWSYGQRDPIYLKGLFKKFVLKESIRLPFKNWYFALIEQLGTKITILRPLKFITYTKKIAVERCVNEVGWVEYPRKHGESFITRFYQSFFLPTRFKYDKRKAHLSALILSGDISRDQALKEIAQDLEPLGIEADIDYLCVKLQISRKQFDDLMNLPKKTHKNYITLKNTLLFRLGKKTKSVIGTDNNLYKFVRQLIQS